MITELKIDGMSCGHCVAAVKKALSAINGVSQADVTLEPPVATVTHDESVNHSTLVEAIVEEGYAVKE